MGAIRRPTPVRCSAGLSDEQSLVKVVEIDLLDGVADGKMECGYGTIGLQGALPATFPPCESMHRDQFHWVSVVTSFMM
ncbi:hypothetical protein Enr13x_56230 [Stieleria neptunia]|uniref:Uncharacterized protein n=1 Tax=Stieleria neptunia TaxID=2527979 RepID=A0A518HY95_9BACT|nr:hypothetical protein Enr13x_56230 [Stieleria neptunia]